MFSQETDGLTEINLRILKVINVVLLLLLLNFLFVQLSIFYLEHSNLLISVIAVGIGLGFIYRIGGSTLFFIICVILALDCLIAWLFYDFSADGNSYHDSAIAIMSSGGNPFSKNLDTRIAGTPIFQWIFPSLYRFLEIGDHITSGGKFLAAFLLFLLTFTVQSQKYDAKTIIKSENLICLLVAAPAIFWSQLFNGYGDYWTYWTCAVMSISFYGIFRFRFSGSADEYLKLLCLSIGLAASVKYQSAILGMYLIAIFTSLLIIEKKYLVFFDLLKRNKHIVILSAITSISILAVTIQKNIELFGHVVPFVTKVRPANILFDNNFYKQTPTFLHAWYSWFSIVEINTGKPNLSILQANSLSDLIKFRKPDLRFGAAGPMWGIMCMLSITILLSKKTKYMLLVLSFGLLMIFIPGIGTVRYYPLIQLLPGLVLLMTKDNLLKKLLLVFSFSNLVLVAFGSFMGTAIDQLSSRHIVEIFKGSPEFTERFDNPSYFRKNVLKGVIKVEENLNDKCREVRLVFPFSPRDGIICHPTLFNN